MKAKHCLLIFGALLTVSFGILSSLRNFGFLSLGKPQTVIEVLLIIFANVLFVAGFLVYSRSKK